MTKIYSTPTCVYCKTLKGYFKKNGIEFEDDFALHEQQYFNLTPVQYPEDATNEYYNLF